MDSTASAMVPRLLLARAPLVGMLRRLFEPQGVGNVGTKKALQRSQATRLENLSTRLLPGRCPTDEQSKLLKALGCDEVQGSMLSAAVSIEEVGKFLDQRPKAIMLAA